MFQGIIECIDHMCFGSKQNNIFDFLGFRINLYNITGKRISRENLASNKQLCILDSHLDDLVIDGRIIKIPSQQKENQYRSHDIIVEYRKKENARNDNGKHEISKFPSRKLFAIVDKDTHQTIINE